ncbi:hypothetical protein BH10BAC5_BH10BAC5_02230 [soil metagenome]
MKTKIFIVIALLVVTSLVGFYYKSNVYSQSDNISAMGSASDSTISKVYTCPMHPEVMQDKPGTCPKCGMDLELKEESSKDGKMGSSDMKNMKDCNMENMKDCKMEDMKDGKMGDMKDCKMGDMKDCKMSGKNGTEMMKGCTGKKSCDKLGDSKEKGTCCMSN